MDASVLQEIKDFFAFLTGIFTAIMDMFKGLTGNTGSETDE